MKEIVNACKSYYVQCVETQEMLKGINVEYNFNENMFDHFCSLSDELLNSVGLQKDMESFNKVMEIVKGENEVKEYAVGGISMEKVSVSLKSLKEANTQNKRQSKCITTILTE